MSFSAGTSAPLNATSPAMATPRPVPANLTSLPSLPFASSSNSSHNAHSSKAGQAERSMQDTSLQSKSSTNGHIALESETDGRMTPLASESGVLAGSDSSQSEIRPSSPHSVAVSNTSLPSQLSKVSLSSNSSNSAQTGLGSLQTEEQVRIAASGKDRMFLLLLAREIESFITKVVQNEQPSVTIPPGTASSSALAALGPSMMISSSFTSSKYQKMLAYKVAEWYGLKGVAGPDGSIVIGVMGTLNPKTPTLHLSDIAPKPPSPKQSFKIMQRNLNGNDQNGSSRASSAAGDESTKRKTLEEREAEYALARQRIYGDTPEAAQPPEDAGGAASPLRNAALGDEIDPVPRYPTGISPYMPPEPVYASLGHPPKAEPAISPPSQQTRAYGSPDHRAFAFSTPTMPYPEYGNHSMQPYQVPRMNHNGHMPNRHAVQQMPFGGQMGQFAPQTGGGYGSPYGRYGWPQAGQVPYGQPPLRSMPEHIAMQNTMAMSPMVMNGTPQAWYGMSYPTGQPMPIIPQGVQYMGQFGVASHPSGQMYPPISEPTPMRPNIMSTHQGSAGSSLSSRSYQDLSRPHSRGSTTSTRSATSSARMGYMYPAGQMPAGFRQHSYKSSTYSGVSNLGTSERRSGRAHSPSSTTTISSRSSRVASIVLQPPAPGQHQLPQRPDWAANNVPYHPSPMPYQGGPMPSGQNVSDFPPLHRYATIAEPMQVERAKMRAAPTRNGSGAWNGLVNGPPNGNRDVHANGNLNQSHDVKDIPVSSSTPQPRPMATIDLSTPDTQDEVPRLAPRASLPQPSELMDENTIVARKSDNESVAVSTGTAADVVQQDLSHEAMSPQDVIEAKLAALSVSAGISIGPPPTRVPPQSYAKIVKRD
ncbi:hypothetical protein BD324DRAFT_626614 [Kockovaella imperatae]|uniref:SUZ domain-containing protein n=1 Tax=Kockovaella imperatae TaxID=4999 RepID=A0A1Y1UGH3_9TREE|nr:hypothetical protein BD324DRAFT_626614 [Kockovaella imperatae]ORX36627.1 hypothetical protein BD324DRAFT_626614 [Kockovaella imperatae]